MRPRPADTVRWRPANRRALATALVDAVVGQVSNETNGVLGLPSSPASSFWSIGRLFESVLGTFAAVSGTDLYDS